MPNADIVGRLLDELAAFEADQRTIPDLQHAILDHGRAMEAMPRDWYSQLNRWEGALELAFFTESAAGQAEMARQVIGELRAALAGKSP